jgi:hypothetical protein
MSHVTGTAADIKHSRGGGLQRVEAGIDGESTREKPPMPVLWEFEFLPLILINDHG